MLRVFQTCKNFVENLINKYYSNSIICINEGDTYIELFVKYNNKEYRQYFDLMDKDNMQLRFQKYYCDECFYAEISDGTDVTDWVSSLVRLPTPRQLRNIFPENEYIKIHCLNNNDDENIIKF